MAGRTLRDSRGRWNGSTKGFGKGKKKSGGNSKAVKTQKSVKSGGKKVSKKTPITPGQRRRRKGAVAGGLLGTVVLGPGIGTAIGATAGYAIVSRRQSQGR